MKTYEIRPSTIQSQQLCPGRTMLTEHPDFDHVPNEALAFGSLVHWRIGEHLISPDQTVSFNAMVLALDAIIQSDAGLELTSIASPKAVRTVVSQAFDAYEAWVKDVMPHLPKRYPAIETPMRSLLYTETEAGNEHEVWLTGTPDAVYVDGTAAVIYDWKTAGKAWDSKKYEAQIQPLGYRELASTIGGVAGPESIGFYFGIYDRSADLWHVQLTGTEDLASRMAAFRIQAIASAYLAASEFPFFTPGGQAFHKTRGWHCSPRYCSAWQACKGKYLINDGNADAEPLTFDEKGWV